jgi:hypothetical protein
MITTDIGPLEDILSSDAAELLSCALSHRKRKDTTLTLTDPYFTDKEWEHVLKTRSDLVEDADQLLEGSTYSVDKAEVWRERKRTIPLCNCTAHTCCDEALFRNVLGLLVPLQPPLTDDSGNYCASVLLPYILKMANLSHLMVRATRGGAAVHYMLRLPSGAEYLYAGWPDFHIYETFSREQRQLGMNLSAEEAVRAVGEVQSPPGTSTTAKNRAFAQAGIYTLGHFSKTTCLSKLATVVLYKDLTAHVALAAIRRASGGTTDVLGSVSYKLVHSINTFNLQCKEDVTLFASVFVATVKTTLNR